MRRTSVETKILGERFRDIEKPGAEITQNDKIYRDPDGLDHDAYSGCVNERE
jgi:hypothetical protein